MKKMISVVLAAAMALSLVACGGSSTETEAAAETTAAAAAEGEEAAAEEGAADNGVGKAGKEMGGVLILNTNLGDHAICDLSNKGLQEAAEKYGFEPTVVELGGDVTLQVPTMQEYAEDPDCDIIVAGTSNLKEAVQQVAQEYPDQKFILYDAQDELQLPNIFSMDHAQNEGAYIAGVAAALLTTSDAELANPEKIVGFVGGGQNTALEDYLIGYIQGVHSVDEDIDILVSWIGDFKDTAKGMELATAQASQGADVIFSVAGVAGLGTLSGCAESNIYAIGVDSDQYTSLLESDPETAAHICTSMLKNADVTVSTLLGQAIDGTLEWGSYVKWGLQEGVVGLAMDNDNYQNIFTDEMKAEIAAVQEAATNGELEIVSAIGLDNDTLQEMLATASK